jgi:hypothetical protein
MRPYGGDPAKRGSLPAAGPWSPKQVLIWPDLPRSTVGKVRGTAIKGQLRSA